MPLQQAKLQKAGNTLQRNLSRQKKDAQSVGAQLSTKNSAPNVLPDAGGVLAASSKQLYTFDAVTFSGTTLTASIYPSAGYPVYVAARASDVYVTWDKKVYVNPSDKLRVFIDTIRLI